MATKKGYRVKIAIKDNDTTVTDAAIDVMQAAIVAFDANIVFTNELVAGKKVAFSFDLDYVEQQDVYGQVVMKIAMAFGRVYVLVPTVESIDITL